MPLHSGRSILGADSARACLPVARCRIRQISNTVSGELPRAGSHVESLIRIPVNPRQRAKPSTNGLEQNRPLHRNATPVQDKIIGYVGYSIHGYNTSLVPLNRFLDCGSHLILKRLHEVCKQSGIRAKIVKRYCSSVPGTR